MKVHCRQILILLVLLLVAPVSTVAADTSLLKFKVGVIAPLSGALSEYGIAAKNGIEMAKLERPNLFNHVEFTYEDSQWLAKSAVSAFRKLRSVDKVSLILNWGNPTTKAIAPLAERYRTPLIGMTLDPKVALGKKYVIRSTNPASLFSTRLAQYLKSTGYKNLGVVIADNTYVQGLYDGLKASLAPSQKIEIIERYNLDDRDFRSAVTKIRSHSYDAIGVFLISGQVSGFYRQLSEQQISTPTFGTDFFESSTEINLARGRMEGAVYTHLGISDVFKEKYISLYKNNLQIAYAANWHDMAMLIGSIFNNNPEVAEPDAIMTAIRKSGQRSGAGGNFKFRETVEGGPYFEFPVQVKIIKNNSVKVLSSNSSFN